MGKFIVHSQRLLKLEQWKHITGKKNEGWTREQSLGGRDNRKERTAPNWRTVLSTELLKGLKPKLDLL